MTSAPLTAPSRRPLTALVVGAGPTGALAALALADAGWKVILVDSSTPAQIIERTRAYAFTHSSRVLLERLRLWPTISAILEPFERLELEDLAAREGSRFTPKDLGGRAATAGHPVGWIGEHHHLMGLLFERLEHQPAIQAVYGPNASGPMVRTAEDTADWIIAADGPLSPTRESRGIGVWRHSYRQHCLTAQVRLRGAPRRTAWERLRPEGPFALLPMGGEGRFQVVWSAPAWRCRQLQSLSPAAFLDALAPVLPPGVDVESIEGLPQVFPVSLQLARQLHRDRTILVGETAHRCHPVGGQGLNLSWRDVAALHRLAQKIQAGQLPLASLGGSYSRRRWADVCLTLFITDGMVRFFSNRHPFLVPIRRLMLAQLERFPLLRRSLLGVMTNGPCQVFSGAST